MRQEPEEALVSCANDSVIHNIYEHERLMAHCEFLQGLLPL